MHFNNIYLMPDLKSKNSLKSKNLLQHSKNDLANELLNEFFSKTIHFIVIFFYILNFSFH